MSALGVAAADELLEPAALAGPQASTQERPDGDLVRYPRPGSMGLGRLSLRRWRRVSPRSLMQARFTCPRSTSLAERVWNIACHLRSHGVGTPDLVAVGARGGGLFCSRSFLVTRELEGYETLRRWLAEDLGPLARRRGAVALGHTLARLLRSGAVLPALDDASVHLSIEADEGHGEGCLAESGGPQKNRMSSVAVSALEGARIVEGRLEQRASTLLQGLDDSTRRSTAVTWRWRARVLVLAVSGAGLDRSARRRLWALASARSSGGADA